MSIVADQLKASTPTDEISLARAAVRLAETSAAGAIAAGLSPDAGRIMRRVAELLDVVGRQVERAAELEGQR